MTKTGMKKAFIGSVTEQLEQYYMNIKQYDKDDEEQKHKIEGFMYAGVVLEITNNKELTELMLRIYFDVFGMTPSERKLIKEKGEVSEIDWSYYDMPTARRKKE